MKIRAFISQKAAERISDCQDRFAINAESKIVAVSDGVSQSIFPDYWAQILVNHYTAKGSLTEGERVLLCSEWRNWVLKYIEEEKSKGNNPWRTESNLYEGITAGATLCGVKFTGSDNWTCEVLGDSCLIVVHNNGTKIEILSSQEKEFDTYPDYLDSGAKKRGRGEFKTYDGEISEDKKLILVSDPFSDFFYENRENPAEYIKSLLNVNSHDEFIKLVRDWRALGMHNDDSTVVIVEWDGSSEFNVVKEDNIDELIMLDSKKEAEASVEPKLPEEFSVPKIPESTEEQTIIEPSSASNESTEMVEEPVQSIPVTEREPEVSSHLEPQVECDLEKFKKKCMHGVRQFAEEYALNMVNKNSRLKFNKIIQFLVKNKKGKTADLTALLEDCLKSFVQSL